MTIAEVLMAHTGEPFDRVVDALEERENQIGDHLRLAGIQFGLSAAVVAEVLVQAGLGTPPTEDERAEIRRSFLTQMEEWRQQFGQ